MRGYQKKSIVVVLTQTKFSRFAKKIIVLTSASQLFSAPFLIQGMSCRSLFITQPCSFLVYHIISEFLSRFKECSDYDSHFCAMKHIFDYIYWRGLDCTPPGVQKYFDGILDMGNGISYSNYRGSGNGMDHVDEDVHDRTLLSLRWEFISQCHTF